MNKLNKYKDILMNQCKWWSYFSYWRSQPPFLESNQLSISPSKHRQHKSAQSLEAQGPNKLILDIGCGLGYSTSDSPGCLGVDRSKKSIKKAKKLFPEKRFRHSLKPKVLNDEKYDVVTCMFYLNELPRIVRKDTIQAAIDLAEERVVIVDIPPEYDPNNDLLKSHKHLNDYIKNCRDELREFNEQVYVDGLLNIWI